eukprot:1971067-Pyramimonas_sp.AAC.1
MAPRKLLGALLRANELRTNMHLRSRNNILNVLSTLSTRVRATVVSDDLLYCFPDKVVRRLSYRPSRHKGRGTLVSPTRLAQCNQNVKPPANPKPVEQLRYVSLQVPFPRPAVMGHEVSGEVVAHGPGSPAAQLDYLPVGTQAVGAFIMPCHDCFFCDHNQEEMCQKFFDLNRLKGQLYDGSTRLYGAVDGAPMAMYSMGGLVRVMHATSGFEVFIRGL